MGVEAAANTCSHAAPDLRIAEAEAASLRGLHSSFDHGSNRMNNWPMTPMMLKATHYVWLASLAAACDPAMAQLSDCIPTAISQPAPDYPKAAERQYRRGTVPIQFRVLRDGSVTEVQALREAAWEFIPTTLKAVESWVFAPHTCGDERGVVLRSQVNFEPPPRLGLPR